VHFKELSITSPKISREAVLQAIALAIWSESITSAIESTQSERQRNRKLPTHLVVALIIAVSLWSKDSIEDVLANLVHGLSAQWVRLSQRWKKPSKSLISEARQQVGQSGHRSIFSQSTTLLLIEAGTHLITDALLSPYPMGERRKALKLLRSVEPGMLLMWDRGLHSFKMVQATQGRGSSRP
jgi:Insertion element 4 transposase N-terminal